jgi:hypothetical protein
MPIPDLPSTSMSRVLQPGSRLDGAVRNQVGESRRPRPWGVKTSFVARDQVELSYDSSMGDLGGAS